MTRKFLLACLLMLGLFAGAQAQIDPATVIFQKNGLVVSEAYPNPADTEAFIDYQLASNASQAFVEVVSVLGQQVWRQELRADETTLHIPLTGLKQGVYFYRVEMGGQKSSIHKLVVR